MRKSYFIFLLISFTPFHLVYAQQPTSQQQQTQQPASSPPSSAQGETPPSASSSSTTAPTSSVTPSTKPAVKHRECSKFRGQKKEMCEKHMNIADLCFAHCAGKRGAVHQKCMRETIKKYSEEACKDKVGSDHAKCMKEHMELPK